MATSERLEECEDRLKSLLRELEGLISVTLPACTGGKERLFTVFVEVMLATRNSGAPSTSVPRREKDWRSRKTGTGTTEVLDCVFISIYVTFVDGRITVRGE